jgi:hypothetical protein
MTRDDAEEKGTLMDADSGSSRMGIDVTLDPRPLRDHRGPTDDGDRADHHEPQR